MQLHAREQRNQMTMMRRLAYRAYLAVAGPKPSNGDLYTLSLTARQLSLQDKRSFCWGLADCFHSGLLTFDQAQRLIKILMFSDGHREFDERVIFLRERSRVSKLITATDEFEAIFSSRLERQADNDDEEFALALDIEEALLTLPEMDEINQEIDALRIELATVKVSITKVRKKIMSAVGAELDEAIYQLKDLRIQRDFLKSQMARLYQGRNRYEKVDQESLIGRAIAVLGPPSKTSQHSAPTIQETTLTFLARFARDNEKFDRASEYDKEILGVANQEAPNGRYE